MFGGRWTMATSATVDLLSRLLRSTTALQDGTRVGKRGAEPSVQISVNCGQSRSVSGVTGGWTKSMVGLGGPQITSTASLFSSLASWLPSSHALVSFKCISWNQKLIGWHSGGWLMTDDGWLMTDGQGLMSDWLRLLQHCCWISNDSHFHLFSLLICNPYFLSLKLTVRKGQHSLLDGDGSKSYG